MRIFIVVIFIGLLSCSRTNDTQSDISQNEILSTVDTNSVSVDTVTTWNYDYESFYKLESYLIDSLSSDSTIEIVDFDCAILVYPTSEQIDEMREADGEEDFYTAADDSNWYQSKAIEILDSLGVKQVLPKGQYLRIKGENRTWDLDIRKKNLLTWNLIFFNRNKEPQIISTVDLTIEQVGEYFEMGE